MREQPTLVSLGNGAWGHVRPDAGYRHGEQISLSAYSAATVYRRTGKLKAVPQRKPVTRGFLAGSLIWTAGVLVLLAWATA